jgi:hypothetical protein
MGTDDKTEERSAKRMRFVMNPLDQQSYLNLPHRRHNHWFAAESPEVRRQYRNNGTCEV